MLRSHSGDWGALVRRYNTPGVRVPPVAPILEIIMSYRKIEVDGKTYEYVIGRQFVKFRHDRKAIPVAEIGVPLGKKTYISPKFIAAFLRGNPLKTRLCKKHNFICTEMRYDPFDIEIHDKKYPMWYCPECYQRRREDI